ncbi:BAR/IMD domain-containing adapter protein 2-like [Montipora capricornis]|uniref:BAR/IMD domain-containing adapter protein 2-like n=1 Tax=Montipora capricornis TaxID=246305 RepID=UPI0035F11D66
MDIVKELETKTEEELHNITILAYQNIINLYPALKELFINAKNYQKSLQNARQAASLFHDSLAKISQLALDSKGTAHNLGETISDVVAVNRDIEARQVGVMKYLQNDLIVPLEDLIESEISGIKLSQKNYGLENKSKVELVDKAKGELLRVRKKSQRKKPTGKYEEKEKQCEEQVESLQNELHGFRLTSCRKAISEEQRRYCFVLDRTIILAKSTMEFCEHNSQVLREKLPVWLSFEKRKGNQDFLVNGSITDAGKGKIGDDRVKLMAKFAHAAVEPSQLSFQEGDTIHPISEVVSGWQYGESTKTKKSGWFPAAYMEQVIAISTGPTVSHTLPAGGVHLRPTLGTNIGHKSLKRYASDGCESPQLPPPDYADLENKQDGEQSTFSNNLVPSVDQSSETSTVPGADLNEVNLSPVCRPPPPPPLLPTLSGIEEVTNNQSVGSEAESNGQDTNNSCHTSRL